MVELMLLFYERLWLMRAAVFASSRFSSILSVLQDASLVEAKKAARAKQTSNRLRNFAFILDTAVLAFRQSAHRTSQDHLSFTQHALDTLASPPRRGVGPAAAASMDARPP